MSTTIATTKLTAFEKYAAILLPAFVLVFGGLQALEQNETWVGLITFLILVAGAIGTFVSKLVDAKWAGIFKTGIPILTAVLSALIPLVVNHEITKANVPMIVTSILQVILTEVGSQIRSNALIDAGTATPGVAANITSLPPEAPSTPSPSA